MRYLIKEGTVYDGLGNAPIKSDILIEDGLIEKLQPRIEAENAQIIDASGFVVTPGFVDMHRHCDIAPMRDADFGLLELSQGITTTFVGNCGLAPVPINHKYSQESRDFLEPVTGNIAPLHTFENYSEYFNALESAKPSINMGVMAGSGSVKTAVKGFENSPYTIGEMEKAAEYLEQAMNSGAFGVSLGIMYTPECYSDVDEIVNVIKPVAKVGGLLTAHIRGEGDSLVSSIEEVIKISEKAEIRLNVSHFKATGIKNWNKAIYQAIEKLENARARSMEVSADFYPYIGGATTLLSLIPPSVLNGGGESTIKFLSTNEGKGFLRSEIYKTFPNWDSMVLSIGWDRILISNTSLKEHAKFGGRDIASLSNENGYYDPSDFVCDLLVSERGRVGIIVLSMSQKDVDTVAALPYTSVISDALYGGGSNHHPRLYGAFPKVIREYVIERKILKMETAIYKMSGMPSNILRLGGRGVLAEGNYADINIFKPEAFYDKATFTNSRQLAEGMSKVFINGELVFQDGLKLESSEARILRKN